MRHGGDHKGTNVMGKSILGKVVNVNVGGWKIRDYKKKRDQHINNCR
jgi:hypothetical protein